MDWTYGYVQEVGYTHGYYRELTPSILSLACVSRSMATLLEYRPLRYLELAFGQGLSVNIHAAACPGEFWGTDFNPAHAINARELAAAAGSGARLFDESFEEFGAREDLPEFDVIGMHGTWSWISPENRRTVVDIVRRKLAPGGVFYVSYNCWPGWASDLPLRHLLKLHTELASPLSQGLVGNIDAAIAFAQSMLDAGARYFSATGGMKDRLDKIRGHNRNYVAHEYFNQDWAPMPFADVARDLAEAKLSFAASANLADHLDGIGASEEARKILAGIQHPVLRETVLDYIVNQRFRRDVFVKGPRRLSAAARDERMRNSAFVLLSQPDQVPKKVTLPNGEAELNSAVYTPILEALGEDGLAPKTLGWLQAHPKCRKIKPGQWLQAVLLLTGTGHLHPAQPEAVRAEVAPRCAALNKHLIELASSPEDFSALASPVTGGGVNVPRHQQLFLRARAHGLETQEQWARHAWECFAANGQRLITGGKTLETVEDNLAYLVAEARVFADKRLDVLKVLGVTA